MFSRMMRIRHIYGGGLMLAVTAAALTALVGCANLDQPGTHNTTLLDRSNLANPLVKLDDEKAYEYASSLQFGGEAEQKKAISGMERLLCSPRYRKSRSEAVVTQSLIHAMHSDHYTNEIRQRSAKALRESKDANARDALINALGTVRDGRIRQEAAASLGKMRDAKSVKYLEFVLLNDQDKNVRAEAARALALIGDKSCLGTLLIAAKSDRDSYVRWRSEKALGRWLRPTNCEMMMSNSRYRTPRTFRFGASRLLTVRPEPLPNPAEVDVHIEPVYKSETKLGERGQGSERDGSPATDGLMAESSPGLGPF